MKMSVKVLFVRSTTFESIIVSRKYSALPRVGEFAAATLGSAGLIERIEWTVSGVPLLTVVLPIGAELPTE